MNLRTAEKRLRRQWRDLLAVGLLLVFPLLLFAPVSLGTKTLLPVDVLFTSQPFRMGAAASGITDVQNPLLADLILENYVWKQLLVDAVKDQTLPLWDPYLFTGHPFLANGQHSALYPLTWVFLVMPIPRAFGVFIVLQLGLAGVWMYVLGRVIKAGPLGSLVAGIVFQFSGFMVVSVVHPMIVAGASWLPLLLALVECTIGRRRFWTQERAVLPWALLGAIALGLQTLAGHPETTYFVLLVVAGFAGWRLIHRSLTLSKSMRRSEVLSPALGVVLIVVLGLVLGAVQLLPFYEVARDSFRQGAVTLQQVLGWAYPVRRLITFFIPNFYGNPTHRTLTDVFSGQEIRAGTSALGDTVSSFDWGIKNYVEGGAYLGILPLLLAGVAVLRPGVAAGGSDGPGLQRNRLVRALLGWIRQPYVPLLVALATFSLACMYGTPVYALVYVLPFMGQSHSPFRWVFPFTVAVAALAGLGVSAISTACRQRSSKGMGQALPAPVSTDTGRSPGSPLQQRSRLQSLVLLGAPMDVISVTAVAAIWGGFLTGVGVLASFLAYDAIEPLVSRAFWSLARAANVFPDARAFYSYLVPGVLRFAAFLLSAGIVLRVSKCPIHLPRVLGRLPVWKPLAVIVVLVDLVLFGAGFNPAVAPALLEYQPPVVDFLKQDGGLWRLSTFDPEGRGTLPPNTSVIYGLQDVRGYDSLFSAQYARYMGWIEPQGMLPYNQIAPFRTYISLDSPLTDLLNVKYVITEHEVPLPKYRQVYQDEAVRVYENLGVAPRAFTLPVAATVEVADGEAVGEAILTYDPRHYVIIESAAEARTGPAGDIGSVPDVAQANSPVAQEITHYALDEVMVEVVVDEPGWLVLTDAFAPGWKAFVRPPGRGEDAETEVGIYRVAGNFRGIRVDGAATVRLKYSPDSVKVGAFSSFVGGMVVLFLAVVWLWRLAYQDHGDQNTVQRLAKNSIVPILLTLFNRVLDFAFAALMMRILGPSSAGDYYYATKIFVWFDILTNFGLNTYLTREVSRDPEHARRYLTNTTLIRLGLSVAAVPVLLGFLGVRQTVIASMTSAASSQVVLAIVLLYIGLVPNSISTGLTALYYAYEKAEYPAAITTVTSLLRVTVQTLALVVGWGIVGLAGTSILINLVTLAILLGLAWRTFPALRKPPQDDVPTRSAQARLLRREMIGASWPLMLNHLLATLFYTVDIFLMEPILGPEAVGFYSIGGKLVDAMMVIPSMFTMALFPVVSRQAQGDRAGMVRFYRLGAKMLFVIALPLAIISTILAREMVLLLGGTAYIPGSVRSLQIMVWLMPISWINGITQYVLIALDKQRYLTRAYTVTFGFALVTNLIGQSLFGYEASAVVHILSELVLLVPFAIGVRRYLGDVGWREVVGKPIVAAAAAGIPAIVITRLVGTGAGAVTMAIVYALLVWRVGAFSLEERAVLAPLLRRSNAAGGQ